MSETSNCADDDDDDGADDLKMERGPQALTVMQAR